MNIHSDCKSFISLNSFVFWKGSLGQILLDAYLFFSLDLNKAKVASLVSWYQLMSAVDVTVPFLSCYSC